ncbi:MAG: hypothetical protein NZM25_06085 [Leptospiraceae bacterium]|nr:hypothetical protein [Leptospiraceae bacterium]MDW8306655.1 ATP-binding protein [Leptospiraceae bacterium]
MFCPATGWEEKLSKNLLNELDKDISIEKIYLGFSGGADSVLSLYFILAISSKISLKELHLFFLDHGLPYPDMEMRKKILYDHYTFAKNFLGEQHVSFHLYHRPVKRIAKRLKTSFERAGSLVRRRLLEKIAPPEAAISTGHNLSDWLETVVLRLNRGASPNAIYPIATLEKISGRMYLYPVAHLTRSEIRDICQELKLPYWDDPYNAAEYSQRGLVRQVLTFHPTGLRRSRKNFLNEKISPEIILIPSKYTDIAYISNFENFTFLEIKKKESFSIPLRIS